MAHLLYPDERHIPLPEGDPITEEEALLECGPTSVPYLYNGTVYQCVLANITDNVMYGARDINGNFYTSSPPDCVWIDETGFVSKNRRAGVFKRVKCGTLFPYTGPPDFQRVDPYNLEEEVLAEWTSYQAYKESTQSFYLPGIGNFLAVPFMTEDFGQLYFQNLGLSYMKVVKVVLRTQYSNVHTFSPVSFAKHPGIPPIIALGSMFFLLMFGSGGVLSNQSMVNARIRRRRRRISE